MEPAAGKLSFPARTAPTVDVHLPEKILAVHSGMTWRPRKVPTRGERDV